MREKGFIAITSAIIISVLLLAITLAITFSAYFARFNVLDSESKERSSALAEACSDAAVLEISGGKYSTNELLTIGPGSDDDCTIVSVGTSGSQNIIKSRAVINQAYTNLRIGVDSTDFTIKSWDECTNLTAATNSC